MDINMLEYAARTIFRLCEQHPELCPHDWSWTSSIETYSPMVKMCFKCRICGQEKAIEVPQEEYSQKGPYGYYEI